MIHVVCADISGLDGEAYKILYNRATPERKARADRYRRREDAIRCVTGDALLRRVLGTDCFTVEKSPQGKPYIPEKPDFHYNLSHAGSWVVIAYGESEVGVDVEQIRETVDIASIAGRFFTQQEQRYIRADPACGRSRFFEVWTAKESYVKYLGTGLQKDLTSFDVFSPEPGIRFHRRELPGSYFLTLCCREAHSLQEVMDARELAQPF